MVFVHIIKLIMIISNAPSISVSYPQKSTAVASDDSSRLPESSASEETETTDAIGDAKKTAEIEAEKAQKVQDDSVVRQLQSRDREVRAHESAHAAAGGGLVTGGPSFTFQKGPDGRSYAVGGEVQIDTSSVKGDPQATIVKANQIRAAALAPAEPSGQDVKVAANATQLAAQARVDLATLRREEANTETVPVDDRVGVADDTETPAVSEGIGRDTGVRAVDATSENSPSGGAVSGSAQGINQVNNQAEEAISAFLANAKPQSVSPGFSQFA